MDQVSVRAIVETIIRQKFPGFKQPLLDATTARDVPGWDSVAHFNLLLAIEEKVGIELDAVEGYSLKNVGELIEFVSRSVQHPEKPS